MGLLPRHASPELERSRHPRLAPRALPARQPARRPPGRHRQGRPDEPVHRRRSRRPPRERARRRPHGAHPPLPVPLRAARRAEVHARRTLRVLCLAGRLGEQVRHLEPESRRRGARRHQHPQRRRIERRTLRGGSQLSARQPGHLRRRSETAQGDHGRQPQGRRQFAHLGGVRRRPAQELHRRPQGSAGSLGDFLRSRRQTLLRRLRARLQDGRSDRHAGLPQPPPHRAGRAAGRLLLHPELRKPGRRQPRRPRPGGEPRRAPPHRRAGSARHAAPGLGHLMAAGRAPGGGQHQPQGRPGERDRHAELADHRHHSHPRPRLLPAQPRAKPLRLGRLDDEPRRA